MHTDKELEAIKYYSSCKIDYILNDKPDFTADDMRDLQTLVILKDTARQKIQRIKAATNET